MAKFTDLIDLSPSRALNEVTVSPLEDSGGNTLGQKKNHLTNCALEEQVERDKQRKFHRKVVFVFLATVCPIFYTAFLCALWDIYKDIKALPLIPVAWVLPILSLVTVPTILLVIMILCLYREKNNVGPASLLRITENAMSSNS